MNLPFEAEHGVDDSWVRVHQIDSSSHDVVYLYQPRRIRAVPVTPGPESEFSWKMASILRSIRLMKNQPTDTAQPALQRDPDEWKTGDEPMTDAQRSYLETLCRETGQEFDDALTKAEASKRIDELRARSPRLSDQ